MIGDIPMRQQNSMKNFFTSLFPFIILMFIGFWKVSVWQRDLGNDIFALNQLFFQIFAYLSLAEAGVGALVQNVYYKLLIDKKNDEINIYYTLSKRMLRWISLIILVLGVAVSFFLNYLTNNQLSLTYMQVVFLLFLVKNLVDYFMFSPRFVLQADQKIYKINVVMNFYKIVESLAEVLLIMYGWDYVTVLIVTIFIRILTNVMVNKVIFKEYSWLKEVKETGNYKITGMAYALNNKFIGAAQDSTDILLISAFLSPLAVTIYSSYKYITKYLLDFIYLFASSIMASVGNLIYEEENERSFLVFEEIIILFYFVATFLGTTLLYVMNNFISIWVGADKVLDGLSFLLIILFFFNTVTRRPYYLMRDVLVLYKDTQTVSIIEVVINIILSVILVKLLGLKGILIAVVVSSMLLTFWYYPYIIYKNVYAKGWFHDLLRYSICLSMVLIIGYFSQIYLSNFIKTTSMISWFIHAGIYSALLICLLTVLFYAIFPSFRRLTIKGKNMIINKFIN